MFCILSPRSPFMPAVNGARAVVERFGPRANDIAWANLRTLQEVLEGTRFPYVFAERVRDAARTMHHRGWEKDSPTRDEMVANVAGCGMKVASLYLMYVEPEREPLPVALDMHLLAYLKGLGCEVPEGTPRGGTYRRLEEAFRQDARGKGVDLRDHHYATWAGGVAAGGKAYGLRGIQS